ncbi:MAG: ATP-grasp domain-containing protein [Gemmatales bacterium]|nr:ATP-grasp domain-containing protein [Gemmatales bacterium]MDW7993312.1 ATP-grasp domain-containing protein [Gemmatales bacterium]
MHHRCIFLYEYACAVGRDSRLPESFLFEGRAMRDALAEDLARAGCEVILLDDISATEEYYHFQQCLRRADAAWIIAPEIDCILVTRCQWVEAAGIPLLGTDSEVLSWLTDKWQQYLFLQRHGVPVPASTLHPPHDSHGTYVRKPRYGAGCFQVEMPGRLATSTEKEHIREVANDTCLGLEPYCFWQRYMPGQAASIACLCGPRGQLVLRAAAQLLLQGTHFCYLGGYLPLPEPLELRAQRLAYLTLAAVPCLRGYIGIDLVLGAAPDGSEDYVIEINPRLTTSYLGQRALCEQNLAELALAILQGDRVRAPSWRLGTVKFTVRGTVVAA